MNRSSRWKIHIDTGGTFTDCIGTDPDGREYRCKVLSSSALRGKVIKQIDNCTVKVSEEWNVPDNFISGFIFSLPGSLQETFEVESYEAEKKWILFKHPVNSTDFENKTFEVQSDEEAPLLAARVLTRTPSGSPLPPVNLRLATTKGTNALLEKKGDKTVFFITRGFKDLLLIGEQHRNDIFSLKPEKPNPLYHEILEIDERIDSSGKITQKIDTGDIDRVAKQLINSGIGSAAICFMNSYKNSIHEEKLAQRLKENEFRHVTLSSYLSPLIKIIPRARTADVNAYLSPVMKSYFDNIAKSVKEGTFRVMTSSGGLVDVKNYTPKDSLLSGPAGGVVGASDAGIEAGFNRILSFDMGGTSTDVARFDQDYDYVYEHKVGQAYLTAPALSIETVAAGGGSICSFDGHALQVGPESASADPGPACYGSGGPLTITDVNLLLGRLHSSNFQFPVDRNAAEKKFNTLIETIRQSGKKSIAKTEVLEGFTDIANERMSQAIRKISIQKGFEPSGYAMVAFGGAGAQHACEIAEKLGVSVVLVPGDAGLLSARGLGRAQIERFSEKQVLKPLDEIRNRIGSVIDDLESDVMEKLKKEETGAQKFQIKNRFLFMRFQDQVSTLELQWKKGADPEMQFKKAYKEAFGHWIEDRPIEVESIRVIAGSVNPARKHVEETAKNSLPEPLDVQKSRYQSKEIELSVYDRSEMEPGCELQGPALILDPYSTIFIPPEWGMKVLSNLTVKLNKSASIAKQDNRKDEIIKLELFTNRFRSIAEQMGEKLRRTSLSVNVKERLDFSCALLDKDGYLVVNAPHIPVHLGAMGLCVRMMIQKLKQNREHNPNSDFLEDGDVLITNHPAYGGSHLPDITVVKPVFYENELIGFTACRAHHAEIGGKTPGSMPPDAKNLAEEGVVIPPDYVIRNGESKLRKIRDLIENSRFPSRTPDENIADIEAAIAACHFGANELQKMAGKHSEETVSLYMQKLRSYAKERLLHTLKTMEKNNYSAQEEMDDGTVLSVSCSIQNQTITFDFTGSSGVHPGNLNANPSIVNSVVMYVLRLLIDEPLPLNDGLLDPVNIILPNGILNPEFTDEPADCPAVVGGNIETSQRLVDTLLKAFGTIACSQGTMNNVLFGNKNFGYYETVGGGSGAGNGFDGTDAVHHHMTNTRATDPEILEHRYPVKLSRYEIRKNSGGSGKWCGGNGIIREMEFFEPVDLTILSQHRTVAPYGLKKGNPGKKGAQRVERAGGKSLELDWSDSAKLEKGDRFILETPGGGGYGKL